MCVGEKKRGIYTCLVFVKSFGVEGWLVAL